MKESTRVSARKILTDAQKAIGFLCKQYASSVWHFLVVSSQFTYANAKITDANLKRVILFSLLTMWSRNSRTWILIRTLMIRQYLSASSRVRFNWWLNKCFLLQFVRRWWPLRCALAHRSQVRISLLRCDGNVHESSALSVDVNAQHTRLHPHIRTHCTFKGTLTYFKRFAAFGQSKWFKV